MDFCKVTQETVRAGDQCDYQIHSILFVELAIIRFKGALSVLPNYINGSCLYEPGFAESFKCTPYQNIFHLKRQTEVPADTHTAIFLKPVLYDLIHWEKTVDHFHYIEQMVKTDSPKCEPRLRAAVLEQWMVTGKSQHIRQWLKKHNNDQTKMRFCLQGWQAF